jgi:hypothetical protein
MSNNLIKYEVSKVKINPLFAQISIDWFGYDASEYVTEIATLVKLWQEQGYVEVYQTTQDKSYGLVKESHQTAKGVVVSYYIGLFHARLVDSGTDPLVVIKFHIDENNEKFVDLKFMLDHDEIFGTKKQKYDTHQLKEIHKSIDQLVKSCEKHI